MKVYFVRHGQTRPNALNVNQGENEPLSEEGIKQAEILTERFSKIPIDIIFASSMQRAKQTAEIINKELKKEIIFSDLIREWKKSTEFEGKTTRDPVILEIYKLANLHQDDPIWHYSDEENFIEYRARVKKFLDFLTTEVKQENVLIVSHAGPIKLITFLMALGDLVRPEIFYRFADTFRIYNTSITFCEKKEDGLWSVEAFNDHRHLG